jgi:hypothetical protein
MEELGMKRRILATWLAVMLWCPVARAETVDFPAAARQVMAHVQTTYWNPNTGLYLHSTEKREVEAMWGNGIVFSALVAAAREEPRTYKPVLNKFFGSLDQYWDAKAKIPGYEPLPTKGGNDKYYDDNEWMVLAFLEAYDLTKDVKYLNRADQALKFSLSGWDDALGGGIWWHEGHKNGSKNTCANGPAAEACVRMAEYRRREENIAWAKKIIAWVNEHVRDKDGLYFDSQKVETKQVDQAKLTYNSALMLRANLGLWNLTKDEAYLKEAQRISDASEWFLDSKTGAYRDVVRFSHLQVEADLEFYRVTGDKKALTRARRTGEVRYSHWQDKPHPALIEQASLARMLWLLAEQGDGTGGATTQGTGSRE